MQLEHIEASRRAMQIINVLSYQRKLFESSLPFRKSEMTGIRLEAREQSSPIIEPLPNQLWISSDQFSRRQFSDRSSTPGPDFAAASTAKSRHPALGGDARAGEHGYASGAIKH